jgi:L-seryl-tRNA(Ser) seleniumtransferase
VLPAEAAAVVNNGAAALLLAVNTLAEGREVVVSRGELVEIGGSFRIPDVVRKGGAVLREVGTTNRTRLQDYAEALSPRTGLLLHVHQSNFRIVGFTEAPPAAALAELARTRGLPLVVDQGSGLLGLERDVLPAEATVAGALREGADLVCFSGDKLLGGPQAGLLAGARRYVEAARRNPLYRALRVDKMTLAALDLVLLEHERGRAAATVPVLAMLRIPLPVLERRAQSLAAGLRAAAAGLVVQVVEGRSAVGGGAAPLSEQPTWLVALGRAGLSASALHARLRDGHPPVVARIAEDRVLLDLRTVGEDDDAALQSVVLRAARAV